MAKTTRIDYIEQYLYEKDFTTKEDGTTIDSVVRFFKGLDEWHIKGAHIAMAFHQNSGINISVFGALMSEWGNPQTLIDGRNIYFDITTHQLARFNQKLFNEAYTLWKPYFKFIAFFYIAVGHEDDKTFRVMMKELDRRLSTYMGNPDVFCLDLMKYTLVGDMVKVAQVLAGEKVTDATNENSNENTNNQKQNEMEEPKTLCIALSECEGDGAEMEAVASRIGASIKNGGKTIYNGNDEEIDVPQLFKTAELHPKYVHREQEFGGWLNAKHIKMIDFGKCGSEQRHDLLKAHFDSRTFQAWLDYRKEFDNAETVAVHIDQTDGSWYEYVTNGTTPALEEDAA